MRELIQFASVGGMLVCAGLSAWPFRFSHRWKSWNLYLPVAGLVLYGLYEFAIPPEQKSGPRLAHVVPLQLFLWINGMAKVAVLAVLQERAGGSRRELRRQPQRLWQLVTAAPIALACIGWFWHTQA